jgi:L-fucose isomerase-like protein
MLVRPPAPTRREFGLSALAGLLSPSLTAQAAAAISGPWSEPALVAKAYVAVAKPTWPRPDIDVEATRRELDAALAAVAARHPKLVRFTGGELIRTMDDAAAFVKRLDPNVDGIVVSTITSGSDGMVQAVAKSGLPTLLFLRPYAGHAWATMSGFSQAGNKADVLASSSTDDLDVYARIFHAIHHVRRSRVIVVVPGGKTGGQADAFSRHFGTTFLPRSYADLKAAYDRVDARAAAREAERFTAAALRVVEPGRDAIERAMRFYLGVRELLAREGANAVTVDCLGGINRGELPGYPCAAWSLLLDEGLYGVCQADLQCAMTQLLLTPFSGKPGYLFNPVFDTSRNEILHTHCVAPTAMQGIGGARAPYIIRNHLETHAGVSLQVLLPIGETVTVVKFDHPRRFMISTGTVTGNVDSSSGCRTQIRTKVKDAGKMLAGFKSGVHRVSWYGDYTAAIEKMGRMLAFEVVHEM